MKLILFISIIFILYPITILSDGILINKIDINQYPTYTINLSLIQGDISLPIERDKLQVIENGIEISNFQLQCLEDNQSEDLSVTLVFDISASMNNELLNEPGVTRIEALKEASKKLINLLPNNSEMAILLNQSSPVLGLDFTDDKITLINIVENITPFGSMNITRAILDENYGALPFAKKSKHKKVVIFITDSENIIIGNKELQNMINLANQDNILFFSVTIDNDSDESLRALAEASGAYAYNKVTSSEIMETVFTAIFNSVNGKNNCDIIYENNDCEQTKEVEVIYDNYSDIRTIKIEEDELFSYSTFPRQVNFGLKSENQYTYIRIVSHSDDFEINNFFFQNEYFKIVNFDNFIFPLSLARGESILLQLSNEDLIEDYFIDYLHFETNSCRERTIEIFQGAEYQNTEKTSLEVIYPNGGETLYAKSNAIISWNHNRDSLDVDVRYSTDAGTSWDNLGRHKAKSLQWNKIPDIETDSALLEVTYDKRDNPIEFLTRRLDVFKGLSITEIYFLEKIGDDFITLIKTNASLDFNGEEFRGIETEGINFHLIKYGQDSSLVWKLDFNDIIFDAEIVKESEDSFFLVLDTRPNLEFEFQSVSYPVSSAANRNIFLKFNSDGQVLSHNKIEHLQSGKIRKSILLDDNLFTLIGSQRAIEIEEDSYFPALDTIINSQVPQLIKFNSDLSLNKVYHFGKEPSLEFHLMTAFDKELFFIGKYLENEADTTQNFLLLSKFNTQIEDYEEINRFASTFLGDNVFADYLYDGLHHYMCIFLGGAAFVSFNNDTVKTNAFRPHILKIDSDGRINWVIELNNQSDKPKIVEFRDNILYTGTLRRYFTHFDYELNDEMNTDIHSILHINKETSKIIQGKHAYRGTPYKSNSLIYDDNIYTFGFADYSDFGEGFSERNDLSAGISIFSYIWGVEFTNNIHFDLSDSLWSIKRPGFSFPDTLNFGKVLIGQTKDTLLEPFINILYDVFILDGFNIIGNQFTSTLEQSFETEENIDALFRFSPDIESSISGKLILETNFGEFEVTLLGEGIKEDIEQIEKIIDFGQVKLLDYKTLDIPILRNTSSEKSYKIENIIISNDEEFIIKSPILDILPSEEYVLSLEFVPKDLGLKDEILTIFISEPNISFNIRVLGNAIHPDSSTLVIYSDEIIEQTGKGVIIPIKFSNLDFKEEHNIKEIEIQYELNPTILFPVRDTPVGEFVDDIRLTTISLDIKEIQENSQIDYLYQTTLGNVESTPINIKSAIAYDSNGDTVKLFNPILQDGLFTLSDVCIIDGTKRLVKRSFSTSINTILKESTLELNYEITEKGLHNISIYDYSGNHIGTIFEGIRESGVYLDYYNANQLAGGLYIVVLTTPTNLIIDKLIIER